MNPIIVHAARIFLGAVFLVMGLNGFFNFLPMPQTMPAEATAFMGALNDTGYMFPLIKTVEVVAGALLLSNRFVPLAAVLLAPGIVNIFLFHMFLAPGVMLGLALLLGLCEIVLGFGYSQFYAPVLDPNAKPEQRLVCHT